MRSDSDRDELVGRSARLSSMELASLLTSFRTPRYFRGRRRNFGSFMFLLNQGDGGTIAGRWPRDFYLVPCDTKLGGDLRCSRSPNPEPSPTHTRRIPPPPFPGSC